MSKKIASFIETTKKKVSEKGCKDGECGLFHGGLFHGGLFHGGEGEAGHDLGLHAADEGHGVGDALVPAGLLPHLLARLLARRQVLVGPDVVHVEEGAHLREHARHAVLQPVADAALPSVTHTHAQSVFREYIWYLFSLRPLLFLFESKWLFQYKIR